VVYQREGTIAEGVVPLESRGKAVEVVNLPLRELREHLQAPDALELPAKVIGQICQQPLGVTAGLFGLGAPPRGPPRAPVPQHALGRFARLALVALVATRLDDTAQHVVRQLYAP